MIQHFTTPDGARLAFRDQGTGLPVLCLAGLTRTMGDFDYLRPHLLPLRMITMDYRGRGASDWTGAASYTVLQEAKDALALLDHLHIDRAAILGTSRGGLIGLLIAAIAKDRLLGLCLNDIGPVIERRGLQRIFDYVGRNPVYKTYAEMAAKMPTLMQGFVNVPVARWQAEVRLHYIETENGLKITYDPDLRAAFLAGFDGPEIDLWPLFDTCAGLPLGVMRGEHSDLLSVATVAEMRRRRPDMLFATIPDRAHIPFLDEAESLSLIHHFIAKLS
jgi:pimeloyl-ACP methyl ester carboxylesterase